MICRKNLIIGISSILALLVLGIVVWLWMPMIINISWLSVLVCIISNIIDLIIITFIIMLLTLEAMEVEDQ